jgi:hypothetical protein
MTVGLTNRTAPIALPGRWSWRSSARAAALVLGPATVIGALAWPLLFTGALFNESWANQLWFLWHQSLTIRANHSPSLFLNYSAGVFYPQYLFYGATIFTVFGTLSLALGDAPTEAYVIGYLIAFACAYGGWYWLSRMAGLGRWQACTPGLVYITSGYLITSLYARGDWPELLGVSAIPLMIAAGLSILRADRLRAWPAVALAASAVVFFGAHNITILWGSTILTLVCVATLLCVPHTRQAVTRSGVLRLAAVTVPALLVNAWYLLPAFVYHSQTSDGSRSQYAKHLLRAEMPLVSAGHLFTVSRVSALPGGGFILSLPMLEIGWLVVGIVLLLSTARETTWTRILLVIAAITVLVGVLMTHLGLLLALPSIYAQLEFSYRLETYVLLGVSAAIVAAFAAGKGRGRAVHVWSWALVPILIVSVVGATVQANSYKSGGDRATVFDSLLKPPLGRTGWADFLDLPPTWTPYVVASRAPYIEFPATSIHDDRISEEAHLPVGELVRTNIAGADPSLLHVTGAKIVGVESHGDDVLRIDADADSSSTQSHTRGAASTQTETISVNAGQPLPIVLGRLLTIIAALVLVGEIVALTLRDLRRRAP